MRWDRARSSGSLAYRKLNTINYKGIKANNQVHASANCKTVYSGSSPDVASINKINGLLDFYRKSVDPPASSGTRQNAADMAGGV